MSQEEYHYVRTLGDDGGVEACEGQAIGLDLESIVTDGLPPWKIALEMVAALCEILAIADEDGELHGALDLGDVFVDETGALSIEGWGRRPKKPRVPEGAAGPAADRYGLGWCAYRLMCSWDMPPPPTRDEDAHDTAVIDAVLMVDLMGVPDEMQGDVQWFLAKLMSWDPAERPSAVESWRTFIAYARATEGPDMAAWCNEALDGGGERRQEGTGPTPPVFDVSDDEDLAAPVVARGPLSGDGMRFDPGGAVKGQATAFWSRDAMKAALAHDDEDDAFRPEAGGGQNTGFWTKAQLQAMRDGDSAAPRPKRSTGKGQERHTGRTQNPRRHASLRDRVPSPSAVPDAPRPAPVDPAPLRPPVAPRPVAQGPIAQGPVAQGPVAPAPAGAPPAAAPLRTPPPVEASAALTPSPAMIAGVALLALAAVLLCTGLFSSGGVIYALLGRGDPADARRLAPGDEAPSERAAPAPNSAPAPSKAIPSSRPKEPKKPPPPRLMPSPSGSPPPPRPRPSATPPTAPPGADPASEVDPAAPAAGPARVSLMTFGRGTVRCAGVNTEFDGPAKVVIDAFQLPATCLITIEGARGVFQVHASGTVTCNAVDGDVACDKMIVD